MLDYMTGWVSRERSNEQERRNGVEAIDKFLPKLLVTCKCIGCSRNIPANVLIKRYHDNVDLPMLYFANYNPKLEIGGNN